MVKRGQERLKFLVPLLHAGHADAVNVRSSKHLSREINKLEWELSIKEFLSDPEVNVDDLGAD